MEKKQRNKAKRQLKKSIEKLVGLPMGCSASYKDDTRTWNVWMSVDFDIPEGLELVVKNPMEDALREDVVAFIKEKKKQIESIMLETFHATPVHEKEMDYNFTQTFPPMMPSLCMVSDVNGVRLKTPLELEKAKEQHPSFVDMIERDSEVLSNGYFVYEGTEKYEHNDGFRLVKYSSLRARFTFIIPHEEGKIAS